MKFWAFGLVLASSMVWAQVPQSRHVWIITEENHSYEAVIGNSSMPYFNSLASKYGLATQYYAEQHNSLSALMWLVAGQPITSNDNTTSCYASDNIARHLIGAGLKWRSYQEDLPYAGFTGISYANYVRRHNPIIDFSDTCASGQSKNSVPFGQLATDIANHATPNYAYITPNLNHDAHNGTLASADSWLAAEVPAILRLPEFQPGGDGILFIVWDEADLGGNGQIDNRCTSTISTGCGGRLATLVIGPQVKHGYKSAIRYDHANLLRTICDVMGFSTCPGAAGVANPMRDFFNLVNITTPFPNAAVASPLHVVAGVSNSVPVTKMQVYVDGVLKYQVSGSSVNTSLAMAMGNHNVVVQSSDNAGGIHKRSVPVAVQSTAVVVKNPAPSSVVPLTVPISATANGQKAISRMRLYVDGNSVFLSSGNTLNTSVALKGGGHTLAVEATDTSGNLTTNKFPVTSSSPVVKILSPASGASFITPMVLSTTSIDPTPAVSTQVYIDGKFVYQVSGKGVQALLPVSPGSHTVVVQEQNQAGAIYKSSLGVKVISVPITILSPAANATVTSPVTISASAPSSSPVQTMQIYIDNKLAYQVSGQTIKHSFSLAIGKHYIVAKGWDGSNDNWWTGENINVK
ncbi:MAG TPA: alkaline phosphatase family protein [Terriglobales bacterium]